MKKTSLANRLLSIALCLCMVLSLMPASTLRVFAVDETTGSTDTAASYAARIGDTYYLTLAQAAEAVTEDSNTIEVLTDVTIDADETVTFAAFAQLSVAEGKSITCNGTVTISGEPGLIFENELYYDGGDVTDIGLGIEWKAVYYQAGEGYAINTYNSVDRVATIRMNNAVIHASDAVGLISAHNATTLQIRFSGTNILASTGGDYTYGINLDYAYAYDLTLSGEEGAILSISAGDAVSASKGIDAKSVTVTGGTVNVSGGNAKEVSVAIETSEGVTVAEGATLNLSFGNAMFGAGVAGSISGAGTVNGLIAVPADNALGFAFAASGNTVLIADFSAAVDNLVVPFTVPTGTSLTVKEGVTMDLSGLTAADITFAGTVINNGTILLPADFAIQNAPKSGIVKIGAKTYTYDSANSKWSCGEDSHTGGTATCTKQAVCEICGESYGEVDPTNHDETVKYENGFCPGGCYEPATLNAEGYYEISNAGQLYWFMEKVNSGDNTINGKLTANIVVNQGVLQSDGTLNEGNFRAWTPMGYYRNYNDSAVFGGTFDGDGHTVSGLYFNNSEANYVGLFGWNSGKVQNVGVINCYFNAAACVGGVVSYNYDDGTVQNCYNTGTVIGDVNVGGVVGFNYDTVQNCYNTGTVIGNNYIGGVVGFHYDDTVSNCYNTGTVKGDDLVGGILGYTQDGNVSNCYNTGTVSGTDRVGGMWGGYRLGTLTNCYYLNTCGASGDGTAKTAEQFASGEVAYLLNGSTSEGELVWKQTIGTDASPNFTGKTVYYGYVFCADDAGMEYTNNEKTSAEKPAHTGGTATCSTLAVCTVCGESYGDKDTANHDETVSFDDNGFCPNGCYEPAILNAEGCYEISNAGQLYWFMEKVNAGDNTINGVLTANIVVNKNVLAEDGTLNGDGTNFRAWFPIGYWHDCDGDGANETIVFSGTFDGRGHTVSGLYFNNQNQIYVGLFGNNDSNATVKNVGVIDSYINCKGGAGGVVGNNKGGTVENCYNTGAVSGNGTRIGGVVGNNTGTIANCYNTGTVTCTVTSDGTEVGGVVGLNYGGTVTNCHNTGSVTGKEDVGGVAGENTGKITDCYSTGAVSGFVDNVATDFETIANIGGVVGHNRGGKITDCYSAGTVSGTVTDVDTGYIDYLGGVVGYNNEGTVENCYHTGTVSGFGFSFGGVAGDSKDGTIANCYNTGSVSGLDYIGGIVSKARDCTVENCYNTGSVSGRGDVGGIVGYNFDSIVRNCYNTGSVTGTSYYVNAVVGGGAGVTNCYYLDTCGASGDGTAKTADQFASGEVAYLLNGDQSSIVFKQTIGTDASPNFTGKTVYYGYTFCGDTEKVYINDANASAEKPAHTGGTATCSTPAVCTVCGASYGEVDLTNHDETVSFDDNGFCPSGCYVPATLNAEGCYEISNAGQLYWFMEKVNSGDNTINGVLTDNIVVNKNVLAEDGTLNGDGTNFRAWFPIGCYFDRDGDGTEEEDIFFRGKFDGQGHTVSGLYFNNEAQTCVGLFGEIDRNATVKNVGVIDSYLNGSSDVGGVVGYNEGTVTGCYSNAAVSGRSGRIGGVVGENQGTVENCYGTGTVSGNTDVGGVVGYHVGTITDCYNTGSVIGSEYIGGVVGCNKDGTMTNCYNTGTVSGNNYIGGVVGYNYGTVMNCHNTGSVSCSGRSSGGVVGGGTGAVTNCYYLDTCGASGDGTAKTADQFASGEVAYLLNGSTSEGELVWKQTIGTDEVPSFTGKTVYYGYTSCAEDAQMVYTNDETASETKPGHTFGDNGFCEFCGAYESAALNDGVYEISNAGQLMWFAEFVNAGNFTAGAVLTADIDMNGLMWTPIGTATAYTGTFDGKGFAIKNLWQNSGGANGGRDGLVVTLGTGGAIMGVTVDNAAIWGASLYSTNGAGVIANRNHGTISGCVVKNSSVQQGAYEYLGGIAGENSGTIENCAVIGCGFTRRWGGTDSGSMGAITQTNNGTVKNCFSYGCAFNNGRADKAAIVAINNGTLDNCYYYTNSTVATTYGTAKTAEQFASGEVAYLLGEAFGQTVGTEDHPILGGKTVYYGYVSCADDAVMVYSNDPNVNVTKPAHTLAEDDGDCTTEILCAACGDCVVQGKTAHDFVAGLTCGNDGCKVEATVSVSGNGGQENRYATLQDAFAAVRSATAQDNTVVKLLADIDLDIYTYQITSGIFTLDLNGKTVTSAATWEAITVNGTGAMLTITDSGTGGTIRNMVGTAGTAVGVLEGTLIVSGGILTGRLDGVYVYGGRAEINGGTISGGTCGVDVGEATVTITGGVINGDSTDVDIYGGTVVISGGTFPGGISICYKTTLNAILAEGAAYWQDGKQLTVADDAIEITGGDVVVKPACVHNWVAATCVAPKTCSVCGTTEGEALGHSYKDDVCTVCGQENVPVKLDSASLSFKEKIHYNIFFSLGLDETVDLSDMGLVMFDSLKADGTVDDAIAIHSGAVEVDGKYMIATDGVHAKRLGDTIYFRVYAKLADGSYVYSKTVQYSAVTYAEHILAGDQSESAKALVVAMLNYGAAAQQFFGYNTDDLVNAFLTEEQKALPEQYRDDMVSTVPVVAAEKQGSFANNKGFSKRMPAVSFEGAFEINYFFTPAYAPVDGITLYYWTEADFEANEVLTADNATGSIRLEGTGTEQYRGDIGGIAAKSLSENIYVAAIYSDGTTTHTSGVLGYSIGAYCGRLAAKGSTLADLAMATAVYGYHAKQYFG